MAGLFEECIGANETVEAAVLNSQTIQRAALPPDS
jgi:hypothetical protein